MKGWLRGKGGFTLVEAMISIALLTIMLLAFTLMVATSSRMNAVSQRRQEQFERVLTAVYLPEEPVEDVTSGEDVDETVTVTVNGAPYAAPRAYTAASDEGDVTLTWYE